MKTSKKYNYNYYYMTDTVLLIRNTEDYEEIIISNEGEVPHIRYDIKEKNTNNDLIPKQIYVPYISQMQDSNNLKYMNKTSINNVRNTMVSDCCPYISTISYTTFGYISTIYNDKVIPYIKVIRDKLI